MIRAEDNHVLGNCGRTAAEGITVSQDGRRMYVANSNSNNVTVIDAKSMKSSIPFRPASIRKG